MLLILLSICCQCCDNATASRSVADRLPDGWNLAEIKDAARCLGEFRVLAWKTQEGRGVRYEACLLGDVFDSDHKKIWHIVLVYRSPGDNGTAGKWHEQWVHVMGRKGGKLGGLGSLYWSRECFRERPTDKTAVEFVRKFDGWGLFDVDDEIFRTIDSHISRQGWKWFTGEEPSLTFCKPRSQIVQPKQAAESPDNPFVDDPPK